jgi:hypothetical protein
MGKGGGGTDYEMRGGEEDANLRERRDGTAMGEPHAWCCQEELAPGEGLLCETRGNLERMGHKGVTMMPALDTPRLSLNLLKWLNSHYICLPKLALRCKIIKGGTFIWNHPASFAPSSLSASTSPQNHMVSELHPSSRK